MDNNQQSNQTKVVISDIKMPFWSMVVFMVKWAIAAIPAIFILSLILGITATLIKTLTSNGI